MLSFQAENQTLMFPMSRKMLNFKSDINEIVCIFEYSVPH